MDINNKKEITDLEITMHNLRCATMIGEDMNKKKSIFLFAISMDQKNELNVVSGVPKEVFTQILETLLNGVKNGLEIRQF